MFCATVDTSRGHCRPNGCKGAYHKPDVAAFNLDFSRCRRRVKDRKKFFKDRQWVVYEHHNVRSLCSCHDPFGHEHTRSSATITSRNGKIRSMTHSSWSDSERMLNVHGYGDDWSLKIIFRRIEARLREEGWSEEIDAMSAEDRTKLSRVDVVNVAKKLDENGA